LTVAISAAGCDKSVDHTEDNRVTLIAESVELAESTESASMQYTNR